MNPATVRSAPGSPAKLSPISVNQRSGSQANGQASADASCSLINPIMPTDAPPRNIHANSGVVSRFAGSATSETRSKCSAISGIVAASAIALIIARSSSIPRNPRSPLRNRCESVGASAAIANAPANDS